MKIAICGLLTFFISVAASAAPGVKKQSKARAALSKRYLQIGVGYSLWHESLEATSGGTAGHLSTQFHGMKIGANYQIPFRNVRWVQYYGADFQYGSVKGTGDGTLSDAVKDQPWMGLTLSPGLIYRSTAVSELGFMIPLAYRKVSWELDPAASLEISDKNFSAGLGAIFINRFSRRSSLLLSLTHQQMWTATVWGIGFQYDFK